MKFIRNGVNWEDLSSGDLLCYVTAMARIGFLGLGDMGQAIIPRLLSAGHEVTGWNRSPGKAVQLSALGMRVGNSPAAIARESDFIFSIVTNGAAVKEISLGSEGVIQGISAEAIYLDMSTIEPEVSREVNGAFKAAGKTMVDAPISGSPVTIEQGKASLMIGGDPEVFPRVEKVLLDIGAKATYIGGSGLATQAKLSINALLMIEVIAFGEAVALAEKGGVDREIMVNAILNSVAASPVLGYRGPFILEGKMPAKPLADVAVQQKDMTLVLEQGRRLGMALPIAASANEIMNICRGMGIGYKDFVVAHEAYLRMGGVTT